ncbi:hypothetical protein FOJ82_09125 [Tessaracoccus rhinocerotis]|uniref:Uncharacterized protein n=1 Tax=Tessaracoccus rhinocerotis TaxID=1689449 RepID=A0A553K0H4_9ACTN|nr:hypothetical protein [Tessaracoccus rhinocerotis]TRY18198.1 hypothetical protein FOJ82_09125 [Tessaracoccus rhinocerotis]
MSTRPHTEEGADAAGPAPEDVPATEPVEGEEQDGPQLIEAFGKEAIISIALFIGFVLFVIICLPTYIF